MNLYLSADVLGSWTGGSRVITNELAAFKELGPCEVITREQLGQCQDPWGWDEKAYELINKLTEWPRLCHGYASTFSRSIALLKQHGCKVSWTIAAHNRQVSREEHEKLGFNFAKAYPHLVEELLWQHYIAGYKLADCIICPSTVAANTVKNYGTDFVSKRVTVVPHGCDLPEKVAPLPRTFTLGYLGCCAGPDKGLRYLFEAWKKLNYKDAVLLVAGSDSQTTFVRVLCDHFGGGNVHFMGWVKNVADFYNNISLFCCPAASEGYNIEVNEALSYNRPVICSNGAGAQDIDEVYRVPARDSEALAMMIDRFRRSPPQIDWRRAAEQLTWDKIRQQYINVWKSVLNG